MGTEQVATFIIWAMCITPVFAIYWPVGILYFFLCQYIGYDGQWIAPTLPIFLTLAGLGRFISESYGD